MQLAYDHALDRGNCVFLNEKRPLLILTPLDLTNPLIISVDQPKKSKKKKAKYRGSPDSTVFAHPGNRTIDKTVLFGD